MAPAPSYFTIPFSFRYYYHNAFLIVKSVSPFLPSLHKLMPTVVTSLGEHFFVGTLASIYRNVVRSMRTTPVEQKLRPGRLNPFGAVDTWKLPCFVGEKNRRKHFPYAEKEMFSSIAKSIVSKRYRSTKHIQLRPFSARRTGLCCSQLQPIYDGKRLRTFLMAVPLLQCFAGKENKVFL